MINYWSIGFYLVFLCIGAYIALQKNRIEVDIYIKYLLATYGVVSLVYIIAQYVMKRTPGTIGGRLILDLLWQVFYASRCNIDALRVRSVFVLALLAAIIIALIIYKSLDRLPYGRILIYLLAFWGFTSKQVLILPMAIQDGLVGAGIIVAVLDIMRIGSNITETGSAVGLRDTQMDCAKAIAMVLMIYDHVKMTGAFITSFHMPLFFIISGYFLKKEDFRITFGKKTRSILKTYFKYGIITLIIGLYIDLYFYEAPTSGAVMHFKDRLISLCLGRDCWLLWFLIVLYTASVISAVIINVSKDNTVIEMALAAVVGTVGYILSRFSDKYFWYIDLAFVAVIFIIVGYEMRKYNLIQSSGSRIKDALIMIFAIIIWAIGIRNGGLVFVLRFLPYYPYCILAAICGSYVVIKICGLLKQLPLVGEVLAYIGRNTLLMLLICNIIRQYIDWNGLCGYKTVSEMSMLQTVFVVVCILVIREIGIVINGRKSIKSSN